MSTINITLKIDSLIGKLLVQAHPCDENKHSDLPHACLSKNHAYLCQECLTQQVLDALNNALKTLGTNPPPDNTP